METLQVTGGIPYGKGLYTLNKQYKVIKSYPGSEPEGTVLTAVGVDLDFEFTHYRANGKWPKSGSYYLKEMVENNPEYFQEITIEL